MRHFAELPAFSRFASYGAAIPQRGIGGGNRVRTGDLMLAKHVLYQLSYAPNFILETLYQPAYIASQNIAGKPTRIASQSTVGKLSYAPQI